MTIPLPPYEAPFKPVPQITPFTYRDGITMLKKLENLQRYINRVLVPFVNDNMKELGDAFETQVNALIEAVNAAIALVINDSIEVQDPVVAELIGDVDSDTHSALDDYFVNASPAIDAMVAGLLTNLTSLTNNALDPAVKETLNDVTSQLRIAADLLYAWQKPASVFVPKGNTITDLQNAFDEADAAGGSVRASGTITTATQLNIKTSCDLTGLTINFTADTAAVIISKSNVRVKGLKIVGPGNSVQVGTSRGIQVIGTLATPLSNIDIIDCEISNFKMVAIWLNFVDRFSVRNGYFFNCIYAGIHCFTVWNGVIDGNRINNISGNPLAYGITINKEVATLAIAPRSTDVMVSNNIVSNVPNWEGIDTHGGERITVVGNTVTGCKNGIAIVAAKDTAGGNDMFAPKSVAVIGNTVDSKLTNGTADTGIGFIGAGNVLGTPTEYATGVISGNIVRNYGDATSDIRGAIYTHNSKGLVISDNSVINPSAIGICLYNTVDDAIVTGNVITEVWATTSPRCVAIMVRDQYVTATIVGNRLAVNGEHSGATLVNTTGLQVANSSNTEIISHSNHFTKATTPVNGTAGGNHKLQFLLAAPVGRASGITSLVSSTVDGTYGTEERDVINNTRTRVNEIYAALQALGLIA